jgi:hypothetical protein
MMNKQEDALEVTISERGLSVKVVGQRTPMAHAVRAA